jgi:hypothetical protein
MMEQIGFGFYDTPGEGSVGTSSSSGIDLRLPLLNAGISDALSFLFRGGVSTSDYLVSGITEIHNQATEGQQIAKYILYAGIGLALMGAVL